MRLGCEGQTGGITESGRISELKGSSYGEELLERAPGGVYSQDDQVLDD